MALKMDFHAAIRGYCVLSYVDFRMAMYMAVYVGIECLHMGIMWPYTWIFCV